MKRILVTGSSGFIGMSLSKSLLEDGFSVFGVDNMNSYYDLNLKKNRLAYLKEYKNFQFENIDISNFNNYTETDIDTFCIVLC